MTGIKLPKSEELWARCYNSAHELVYFITSDLQRNFYFFYEVSSGVSKKLGKGKSPKELEKKYDGDARMGIKR